jgi:hypothetical protein
MADKLYDLAVSEIRESKANLLGERVEEILRSLGFDVREGKSGEHRIYTHAGLPEFLSSSFDMGHGKRKSIKLCYALNILRVLRQHESAIRSYLGEDGEDEKNS